MLKDLAFKIVVFGDEGVGKTTLIRRYLTERFIKNIEKTMGVDISIKKVSIEDLKITLQIWDLVGDEKFRFLLPTYGRGASGGIFMYDITKESSIDNIDEWINLFQQYQSLEGKYIPLILVGGKVDLQDLRTIKKKDAISASNRFNFIKHIESSAKTGQNVDLIFNFLTNTILSNSGFI